MKPYKEALSQLLKVRAAIPALQAGKNPNHTTGICRWLHFEVKNLLEDEFFHQWEKFSGSNVFPVPDPDDNLTHEDSRERAVRAFKPNTNKWVGAYGELRIELLNFIIMKLEELCAND